jgi:hypothetical protein
MLLLDMASPNGLLAFVAEHWQSRFKKTIKPPSLRLVTAMAIDGWRPVETAEAVPNAPTVIGDLIIRCCMADPGARPTFDEALDLMLHSGKKQIDSRPADVYRRKSAMPFTRAPQGLGGGVDGYAEDHFGSNKASSLEPGLRGARPAQRPRHADSAGAANFAAAMAQERPSVARGISMSSIGRNKFGSGGKSAGGSSRPDKKDEGSAIRESGSAVVAKEALDLTWL